MRTIALSTLALGLTLAACAPVETTPMPPMDDEADQCMASSAEWLIGKPKSAIPPKPSGAVWRVTCTTCPVTMDYNPNRLNIFYNERTEIVEKVSCG